MGFAVSHWLGKRPSQRGKQRGMTLPEVVLGTAIALVGFTLLAMFLRQQYSDNKGYAEGERIANAADCGANIARAGTPAASAAAPATLVNNGCFGKDPAIQNKGAATATLATTYVASVNYTAGQCNLTGTNDGIYVQTATPNDECMKTVEGASRKGVDKIVVTPSGGTATTVKAVGGQVDMSSAALTGACQGTAPVAVQACIRF